MRRCPFVVLLSVALATSECIGNADATTLNQVVRIIAKPDDRHERLLTLPIVEVATAEGTSSSYPRVRSNAPRITAALADGIERSPSLRRLIQTIDGTDGLVYIHEGTCAHGGPACLMMSVTIAGPHRLLHIVVDVRKKKGCRIVGSIGHELHHAIEALSDPSVRSESGIILNFRRIAPTSEWGRFETKAAMEAGMSVEREACRRTTPTE